MKTLDNHIEFISTGQGKFTIEEKRRFIDINNINKYKKDQVFEILVQFNFHTDFNYSKKKMIEMLMRSKKTLEAIELNNKLWMREKNLQNLLAD